MRRRHNKKRSILLSTMFLYAICLLGLMFGSRAFAEDSLVFAKGPIKVVANYEEPDLEGECGLFPVTLSVSDGHTSTTVESLPLLCREKPMKVLRKLVSWRPPYLAVRNDCGSSNGWNCDTRVIFSFRKGRLTRLGNVNDFLPRSHRTFFVKRYTMLEYNDLIAHTGVPVRLVLRDAGQTFSFDADLTWGLNKKQYNRFEAQELKCNPKQPECDHDFKVAAIFNGTVAKLTGRSSYLQSILTTAQKRLSEEEFRQFAEMLSKVDEQGVIKHITSESD